MAKRRSVFTRPLAQLALMPLVRLVSPLLSLLLLAASPMVHAAGMTVASSAFSDGDDLPPEFAGPGQCGGQNHSLPVSWRHVPGGTRSVVVTLKDPDGAKGMGITHWLAYNINVAKSELVTNEAAVSNEAITLGKNSAGNAAYHGACPPVGDTPHHFILTVTATDLAPGALPPGLDTQTLTAALAGHTLASTSLVARYGH